MQQVCRNDFLGKRGAWTDPSRREKGKEGPGLVRAGGPGASSTRAQP